MTEKRIDKIDEKLEKLKKEKAQLLKKKKEKERKEREKFEQKVGKFFIKQFDLKDEETAKKLAEFLGGHKEGINKALNEEQTRKFDITNYPQNNYPERMDEINISDMIKNKNTGA